MKKLILASVSLLTLGLALNGCKKPEVDTETQSATDNSICEAEFSQVLPEVDNIAINQPGVKKMQMTCYTVTIVSGDTANYTVPVVMEIDFGTTGCVGNDGKTRKGKLEATFKKRWRKDSLGTNLLMIRALNYFVNGVQYEGTMTVSKPALNQFTTTLTGGKCTGVNNSWVLEWNSTRTMTLVSGQGSTAVYHITGEADGVNRNGKAYTINITSPLVKDATCPYIKSGKVELTPDGLSTRTIDYGNGDCDNKARITINGNTFDFTLK